MASLKIGEIGKVLRFPLLDSTGVAVDLTHAVSASLIYLHAGTTTAVAMTFENPRTLGYLDYTIIASDFLMPGIYSLEVQVTWDDGDISKSEEPIPLEVVKALQ